MRRIYRGAPEGSKPPIDSEQTPNPASEESPEAFILLSRPTWATGDEPCSLLVGHGDEVSAWPSALGRLEIKPEGGPMYEVRMVDECSKCGGTGKDATKKAA
jgi:hypothetical protein